MRQLTTAKKMDNGHALTDAEYEVVRPVFNRHLYVSQQAHDWGSRSALNLKLLERRFQAGDDLSAVRHQLDSIAEAPATYERVRERARRFRDAIDEASGALAPLTRLPDSQLALDEGWTLMDVTHRPRISAPGVQPSARPEARLPCGVCGGRGQLSLLHDRNDGVKGCGGSDVDNVLREYRCGACERYSIYGYYDTF